MQRVTLRGNRRVQRYLGINGTENDHTQKSDTARKMRHPALVGLLSCLFLIGVVTTTYASQSLGKLTSENIGTIPDNSSTGFMPDGTSSPMNDTLDQGESYVSAPSSAQSGVQDKSAEIKDTEAGSRTSIVIESHTESSIDGAPIPAETSLTINGQAIELPRSGRSCERNRTEDSSTRICTHIDTDGGTSIDISTRESVDVKED